MTLCKFVLQNGKYVCQRCGMYAPSAKAVARCDPSRIIRTEDAIAQEQGVGTELKKMLAKIGIKSTAHCSCNKRARAMNMRGIDWCEANIDTIVGWLREEAGKRRLPFLDVAGRLLVKRAIRNARKAAAS